MPKRRIYDKNLVDVALTEIKNGLSIHAAARKFAIPRGTLQNRIHNRTKKSSFGPPPVLTEDEENQIVQWLKANHEKGFPRRKEDLQNVVKDFLDASPRDNPFTNNFPGSKWYDSFMNRHPELAIRTPEPITDASSKVAETNIRGWFAQISTYLHNKNYSEIINDPSRVFNGDETNFLMCPKGGKVLAPKGTRNVYEIDRGQAKENLTVMFSFSAAGYVVPPLIIYPYKRVPTNLVETIPTGIKWMKSDSGWMTSDVFYSYIEEVFHPSLIEQKTVFPVILFVDGHKTHLTYKLSKLCESLQIILICLYPNSTRVLQPADVSIFKPLKNGWQKAVQNWRKYNVEKKLTKLFFATILKNVVDTCIHKSSIVNGFRTCGIFPFNPDAIDYKKCLGKNCADQHISGVNEIAPIDKSINFDKFKQLVGQEKLQQLEHFNDIRHTYSEDFLLLHKIYETLVEIESTYESHALDAILFESDVENEDQLNLLDSENIIKNDMFNNTKCTNMQEVQSIEFIDEFQDLEDNVDSSQIPIIFLDDPNVQISNYLVVPPTPIRMGIKNIDRRNFIISSSPFQKHEENRLANKTAIEKEKETRIKEREEKKQKKIAEAILKAKIKKEKLENKVKIVTKKKSLIKKHEENKKTDMEKETRIKEREEKKQKKIAEAILKAKIKKEKLENKVKIVTKKKSLIKKHEENKKTDMEKETRIKEREEKKQKKIAEAILKAKIKKEKLENKVKIVTKKKSLIKKHEENKKTDMEKENRIKQIVEKKQKKISEAVIKAKIKKEKLENKVKKVIKKKA